MRQKLEEENHKLRKMNKNAHEVFAAEIKGLHKIIEKLREELNKAVLAGADAVWELESIKKRKKK